MLFACYGECPRNRFIKTPDGEDGLNYRCAGYRGFFTHFDPAMKTMASLIRQGRYADEIMDRRANAVKTALMSLGVRDEQLTVRGFGENNPVASNDTVDGRQMNRRVEIVFGSQSGLVLAK